MKRFNILRLSVLYCTVLSLAGCGGSSSNDATSAVTDTEAPIFTGYFTDFGVEGLNYKTNTQQGVTDLKGTFSYQAGESVVFSIGDIVLGGSVTAAPEMTPLDLIPDAALPTTLNELSHLIDSKNSNTSESIAFRTLGNMLTFLQALDSDKDASNGITVADGMARILEGESIDFTVDLSDFREIHSLKRIMATAVEQGLISSGFIKQAGQALDYFYQVQEINHSFQSVAAISSDTDNNGSPNKIVTYAYDANGNLLIATDTDGNGSPSKITTYAYDANGNLLIDTRDRDGNGSADIIFTYTVDAYGSILIEATDTDSNGSANKIITLTYDANGNNLKSVVDYNGDGNAQAITTSTYDSNNNKMTVSSDYNANGNADYIRTYTYDSNNNKMTDSIDSNANGTANTIRNYTYDANNNQLTDSSDTDGNGSAESITTYKYDANNNRLNVSEDSNANGSADSIDIFTYDANSNLLFGGYGYDSFADNSPARSNTYTYDDNNNQLTFSSDYDGDGVPNYSGTNSYDANGNKLAKTTGTGSNIKVDTFTYVSTGIASMLLYLLD